MAGATVTNNQANFTKSGQYFNLPSGLFSSYTAMSVEAWVTTGVNSDYARIFQFGAAGNGNTNSVSVCRAPANVFELLWVSSNGTQYPSLSSASFDSQSNIHLVVTVSAGDYARLYINGVLKGMTSAVVNQIPPPTSFYIGKSFEIAPLLIGSVDEFRIWGGALSATDIATRYSQGPGEL